MGKKKLYKEDKTEDFEAEKLELDDPTLDEYGEPITGSTKEDGSISSTDGVSEDKPADDASEAIHGDEQAPSDGEAPKLDDVALPGITDTADNAVKDQDGKVLDDTGSAKPAADAEDKGVTDGVAAPKSEDGSLATDTAPQEASPDLSSEGNEPPKTADGETGSPTDVATGSSSTDAGAQEGGEKASDEPKEEEPKDPATLPGMSPCNGVGEVESQIVVAPATTAVDGVSADDKPPELSEIHDAAKPVTDQLEAGLVDSFKDAGNKATEALHGLKSFEAELAKLPAEAKAIVNQLRHMGAHFVAACERIFKRG